MDIGTKISGIAHLVLIGWVLFGGAFRPEPLPFEVREVSVVTAEEFAALSAVQQSPEAATEPATMTQPDAATDAPDVTAATDALPERDQPQTAAPPPPDAVPEVAPVQPPAETEVTDTVSVLQPPQEQVAVLPPEAAPRPAPRPAERVAPRPVAPPPPDSSPDEVVREEVSPDQGTEVAQEPQEGTAPEEAADQIVTEAEKPEKLAPTQSPRPPARRAPPPTETAAAPAPVETSDAVNAALAEALAAARPAAAAAPTGPPMSAGEKDALRVAVSSCWNVGSLSSAALATTVVVAVSMGQDGRPNGGSVRMLSSSGGSDAAARQAFEAARRAIIRCGASGYDLPVDKYEHWREIEMTFNPERMRIK